jgi:hypothetical protein
MSQNQKSSNPAFPTVGKVAPAGISKNSSVNSENNGVADNTNMDSNNSLNETSKNIAAFALKDKEKEVSNNIGQISTKDNHNLTPDKVGITSALRREFQEIEIHISKGQQKVIIQDSIKFIMRTHQMEQAALQKEKVENY